MNITIRDIRMETWRKVKAEAVREGMTMGEAVNLALDKWLEENSKIKSAKKAKSFWDIKPLNPKAKDASIWSKSVDKTLYG